MIIIIEAYHCVQTITDYTREQLRRQATPLSRAVPLPRTFFSRGSRTWPGRGPPAAARWSKRRRRRSRPSSRVLWRARRRRTRSSGGFLVGNERPEASKGGRWSLRLEVDGCVFRSFVPPLIMYQVKKYWLRAFGYTRFLFHCIREGTENTLGVKRNICIE